MGFWNFWKETWDLRKIIVNISGCYENFLSFLLFYFNADRIWIRFDEQRNEIWKDFFELWSESYNSQPLL